MHTGPEAEHQVRTVLDRLNEAFAKKDEALALRLFSAHQDTMFLGSEAVEFAVGPDDIGRVLQMLFQRDETYVWEWDRVWISVAGETAWLTAMGTVAVVEAPAEPPYPYRLTGVLTHSEGEWVFLQFHGSIPQ